MEFLLVVIGLIMLVVFYFFLGVFFKFVVGWWILIFGTPITFFIGFRYGWVGALVAFFSFCVLLSANNSWHDCKLFLFLEKKLDKIFYMSDT